jgi:hypothetical protein
MRDEGFSEDRVVFVAVLLLALASGATASDQRYLFNKLDLAAGKSPSAVATGDFRGIGKLDLGVANRDSNSISVFLGKPDGTFQRAVDYDVLASPLSVAVGDFNRDHKPDIVVADRSVSRVSILLGNGDGTFQPHVDYPSGTGTPPAPYFIATGDFNNDGKLDLAVANIDSGLIDILLGKGDGTFLPFIEHPGGFGHPDSLAVGDFNNDGKLDLASTSEGSNGVSVWLGNGDGTLGVPQSYFGDWAYHRSVTVADYNGDGNLDLAVNGSQGIWIFPGKGDGTFGTPMSYVPVGGDDLISVDIDGDGAPDIAGPGAAILNTPVAALYPKRTDFGRELMGTSSNSQTVTFSNSGSAPILIQSIAVTGLNRTDFTQLNTCVESIKPGENCIITVSFSPTAVGFRFAYVTILDNAQHKLQETTLTGTGVAP